MPGTELGSYVSQLLNSVPGMHVSFECFFAALFSFLFFLASTDPGHNASIRTKQRNTDNQEHSSLLNDMMTTSRVLGYEIRAASIALPSTMPVRALLLLGCGG